MLRASASAQSTAEFKSPDLTLRAHLSVDGGPRPEVAAAPGHVCLRQRQEAGPQAAVHAQHVLEPVHGPLQLPCMTVSTMLYSQKIMACSPQVDIPGYVGCGTVQLTFVYGLVLRKAVQLRLNTKSHTAVKRFGSGGQHQLCCAQA